MIRALSAALLLAPRAASACAVCFGQADGKSGFANGIFWGIVILLSVTMALVGGIGYAIWSVERERAARKA
ncbi:MAG: hypothetical protein ACHQ49_10675 [Elusimicrobiota bacterium]